MTIDNAFSNEDRALAGVAPEDSEALNCLQPMAGFDISQLTRTGGVAVRTAAALWLAPCLSPPAPAGALPGVAGEIADVIGHERALYLIGQLPRCRVGREGGKSSQVILHVPQLRHLPADHRLVRILGWRDAVKLCQAFGGETLKPPTCAAVVRVAHHCAIRELAGAGVPYSELQIIFQRTRRSIQGVLANQP